MMKARLVLLALLLATAAGCTDTVESVMREYRATTNEAMDGLTMITTEAAAERMTKRLYGTQLSDRYIKIDKKFELVRMNREKIDFVREVLESDGVQIYITDLNVNNQRFALEMLRLRNLLKQYVAREKELLGDENAVFEPREICPYLYDIVSVKVGPMGGGGTDPLAPLVNQLTKPEIFQIVSQFPTWKIQGFPEIQAKFAERRALFKPKQEIRLVW